MSRRMWRLWGAWSIVASVAVLVTGIWTLWNPRNWAYFYSGLAMYIIGVVGATFCTVVMLLAWWEGQG
jgi:hypothetical protein